MKMVSIITDKKLIDAMLKEAEYGTFSLYGSDKGKPAAPYAVPVNYVYFDEAIYFHSSPKGKKMRLIKENPQVSFSVVSEDNIIPSFFSSTSNLACPATVFFKSVTIDGVAEIITDHSAIAKVFTAMMQSLQPEGGYKDFSDPEYSNEFKAMSMVKISIQELTAKFKFGQSLNEERLTMVIEHLKERNTKKDQQTLQMILQLVKP